MFDVEPSRANEVEKQADQVEALSMVKMKKNLVTDGPRLECHYQYPEKEQVDALLSNMMNELTKVFMRARDFILDADDLSSSLELPMLLSNQTRRSKEHRFRVVDKKSKDFFEYIYKNMTDEYQEMYNATNKLALRTERDTCANQDEIKQIWRDILDHSIGLLRSAATTTIQEHLKMHNKTVLGDDKKIDEFLSKEIGKIRTNQLHLLCDQFQLCYNDLLLNKQSYKY